MFDALIELADDGYALSLYPRVRVTRPSDALISRGVAIVGEELSQHLARADVFYDAVIVSRPHNFEPVAHFVREHQPRALLIYDAEALYWRRIDLQAALAADEEEATRLQVAARSMQDSEERMFREADYAVTVSHEEADVIRGLDGVCPISVLLPTEPDIALTTHSFRERRDVGYVAGWLGGADTPNGDGLRWFVSDVLPHLRKIVPWVRLRVTGAKPPEAIRALADPNVHFEGNVDDLARFYDEIRVVIAPIRYGAGVKLKTVHALQHGVPIVATRVGAEGVDTEGLDAIDVVDAPEAFAERVALLLTDPHAWQERRETIEQLVNSWQRPEPSKTWSGALDTAFSGVNRC